MWRWRWTGLGSATTLGSGQFFISRYDAGMCQGTRRISLIEESSERSGGRGQVGSIAGTWGSWYSRIVWCANPSWLPKVAEKTAPRNISQLSRRHMRLHYNLHCNQNLTEEHRAGCPPPANAEKNRAGHERQRWSVIQWVGEISQRTLSVCLIA